MIVEINKENLDLLDNCTLLVKEEAEKELSINPFGKYLVLIENNLIIGFIYYSDIYERAEINQFEIEISNRNCGKGKKLLKRMVEKVDKNISLEVREDNYPAIKIYKEFGFEEKAIRQNYYNEKNGILMERVK